MSVDLPNRAADAIAPGHATISRRHVAAGLLALATVPLTARDLLAQSGGQLADAIRAVAGDRTPKTGRVHLTLPELAENGFSVPLTVTVDSPMTAADHVRSIAILSEKNPAPQIARLYLGARAGRAFVRTHIRLSDTQRIVALAETSDGQVWMGAADVIVTISACVDGG